MLILGSQLIYNKSLIPTFNITNTLTNCTSDNNNSTITAFNTYIANIHADSGYTLEGATVSITMGGVDITSTAYNNSVITIAEVTGNVIINISAAISVIQPTSAQYFTFNNDELTGFSAEGKELYDSGELTELILPTSYSLGEVITTENTFSDVYELEEYCSSNGYNFSFTYQGVDYVISSEEEFFDNYQTIESYCRRGGVFKFTIQKYIDGDDYQISSLGNSCFNDYTDLTSVEIPLSVTNIGEYAFYRTSLTSVAIPNSVTSIGGFAFQDCTNLTSVVLGNSVINIQYTCFSGCYNLESITVSSGNTKYDSRNNCNAIIETFTNRMIFGCKNTIIPNTVTSLGQSCLYRCTGLTTIEIPSSVTSIGNDCFHNCTGLTTIEIPSSVTSIGSNCFVGCTGLTLIEIPSSVSSLGAGCFGGCTGLRTVNLYCNSSDSKVNFVYQGWFNGCNSSLILHIPSSVINPTQAYGQYWNYYGTNKTLTYYADL